MSFASIYGPTSSAHLGANQLAAQDTTHEVLSGFQLEEGHSPFFSLSTEAHGICIILYGRVAHINCICKTAARSMKQTMGFVTLINTCMIQI